MINATETREKYTENIYSISFTKEKLIDLYSFIESDEVKELKLFSNYDKATLLCAIEHLEEYEPVHSIIRKIGEILK